MAANIIARYVWLVDIIRRHKKVSFQDINRLWQESGLNDGEELQLRTFHRHRIAIEEIFGINIDCSGAPHYEYFIGNREALETDELRSWLIDSFAVDNLIRENSSLRDKLLLEKVPATQFLTLIMEALSHNRKLELEYRTDFTSVAHKVTTNPLCLKMFRRRWYLVALCQNGKLKIYSLDRITDCRMKEDTFEYPADLKPQEYFTNSFGIIADETVAPERIVLKFAEDEANYVRHLPLHHSQIETFPNIFELPLSPTYDFVQEILSHLGKVEVVSPEWLRAKICHIAKEIAQKNEACDTL